MDLKPGFIVDSDLEEEVIHFAETTETGFYYVKHRHLKSDFLGRPIHNSTEYIRIKSIWYANLLTGEKVELLPFGDFDINYTYISQNYLYFTKNIDKDGDSRLDGQDYESGEVWRISRGTKSLEYCFDIGDYNFHNFILAGERFIIFTSEDTKPDMSEEVVIDLTEKKHAVVSTLHLPGQEYDYIFIKDNSDNPLFLVGKPWVGEGDISSLANKLWCCSWGDVIKQLPWVNIK